MPNTFDTNYFGDIESNFRDLNLEEKERAFALSALNPAEWEEPSSLEIEEKEVREEIIDLLQDLLGNSWRGFERERKRRASADYSTALKSWIIRNFYNGDACNHFLAWYLEDIFPYRFKPEKGSTEGKSFDIEIIENQNVIGEIEIKRMATSDTVESHYEHLLAKYEESDNQGGKQLFLKLFPATEDERAIRISDLVRGYGYLSPKIDERFEGDSVFVGSISVPLDKKSEIEPLSEIKYFLENHLSL